MELKEYLTRIFVLECNKYELDLLLHRMENHLSQVSKPQYVLVPEIPPKPQSSGSRLISATFWGLLWSVIGAVIGVALYFVLFVLIGLIEAAYEIISLGGFLFSSYDEVPFFVFFENLLSNNPQSIPKFIIFGIVCAPLGFIIAFITHMLGTSNQQEVYERGIIEYRQSMEKNTQIKKSTQIRASILEQQINTAKRLLTETDNTLTKLYNQNIIYQKYQNMVAVSRFLEYISAKRCQSLEGHEGAYNMFENELLLNQILYKLDDIIERLDQIQQNQFMLANAIRTGNQNVQEIYSEIRRYSDTLRSIDDNSRVSAYFGAISAANSTYLAWFQK